MTNWNQQRNDYGKKKEGELQKRLEDFLKEKITRTTGQYDKHDYNSASYDIELKSRQPPFKTTDKCMNDGWLVPACKFENLSKTKKTICFYYFEVENRLFYIYYDKDVFSKFKIDKAPRTEQQHFYIPDVFWTEISCVEEV